MPKIEEEKILTLDEIDEKAKIDTAEFRREYKVKIGLTAKIPETSEEKLYDDFQKLNNRSEAKEQRQKNKEKINTILCDLFNVGKNECYLQSSHWDDFFTKNTVSSSENKSTHNFTIVFANPVGGTTLEQFRNKLEILGLNAHLKEAPQILQSNSIFQKQKRLVIRSTVEELTEKLTSTQTTQFIKAIHANQHVLTEVKQFSLK